MAPPVIATRGLRKAYQARGGEIVALTDLTFEVAEGSFVGIVGPSGCGKSTLLLILAGLLEPSEGTLLLDEEPVRGPQPEKVSLIFQESTLLPWKSALENIEFPLELRGVPRAARREEARRWLELVGLKEFAEQYPHELSGGMRQRVAIARGLITHPRILLMDEPFGSLDEQTRMRMGRELMAIWASTGKTIVFVTHSLIEAVYLTDLVIVMSPRPGRIVDLVPITLARPRTDEIVGTPEFGRAYQRIRQHIMEAGEGRAG